jgi:hypothetical protein
VEEYKMKHKEYPKFLEMSDAFDHCREANRPVKVIIIPKPATYRGSLHEMWKLYPSGRADFIRNVPKNFNEYHE